MGKQWYASKTLWANIIAGIATLATVFGFDLGLTPEAQSQIVAGVMVVVNIVLRFVTTDPISGKGGPVAGLMLCALLLGACSTTDRYNAVASACQTYAVALNTAASLNKSGKLSAGTQAKIDATIPPAKAVCSGAAPADDPAAVQKVANLAIAVLTAQQETAQ